MTTTYRTDWIDPTDEHRNCVDVSFHGTDLAAARRAARKMSNLTGSAYVVKTVDGKDVSHLPYTDGRAVGGWDS